MVSELTLSAQMTMTGQIKCFTSKLATLTLCPWWNVYKQKLKLLRESNMLNWEVNLSNRYSWISDWPAYRRLNKFTSTWGLVLFTGFQNHRNSCEYSATIVHVLSGSYVCDYMTAIPSYTNNKNTRSVVLVNQ